MTKFTSLLAGASLAVLSVASASAADLPSRRAPAPYLPPPPVFTWTGFYAGLNAGGMFLSNNNNNNNSAVFAAAALGVNPFFFGNNGNGNRSAFIGGGQVGYNWQTGPIVFGLEADAQGRTRLGNSGGNFLFGSNNSNGGGFLGTVRGRLGFAATPTFLIYATGGLAYGNQFGGNSGFNPLFAGFGGNNNGNNFKAGYTVGGGLEYMFAPNWSVKAEYLFVDLGRGNNNNFGFGFGGSNSRSQAHVARLGVNYHFNWGGTPAPVVARY